MFERKFDLIAQIRTSNFYILLAVHHVMILGK